MELTEKQTNYKKTIFDYLNNEKKHWEGKIETFLNAPEGSVYRKPSFVERTKKYQGFVEKINSLLNFDWNSENFATLVNTYQKYDV